MRMAGVTIWRVVHHIRTYGSAPHHRRYQSSESSAPTFFGGVL